MLENSCSYVGISQRVDGIVFSQASQAVLTDFMLSRMLFKQ